MHAHSAGQVIGVVAATMAAALLVVQPGSVSAATFEVNSTDDAPDLSPGDGVCQSTQGNCTLRAALEESNATPAADIVSFASGIGTTIVLTRGTLPIDSDVVINGPGADQLTVRRDEPTGQVFFASGQADTSTINGLTISGGGGDGAGGGIFNRAHLTINDSVVTNNATTTTGGGIYNQGGTVIVNRSVISDNTAVIGGGGVYVDGGTVGIGESTVSGNRAKTGAGSYNDGGTLVISASTVVDNSASSQGAGVYSSTSVPPGNELPTEQSTISNSTISGNDASDAGGGVYVAEGTTSIENVTITDNSAPRGRGAGVAAIDNADATVTLWFTASIVAGNDTTDFDLINFDPSQCIFISQGYNVIGDGNAASSGCWQSGQGADRVGINNPRLGALADNGGPTQTHALLSRSPAIDLVTQGCPPPNRDQRGAPRPQGAACDAGSFELEAELGSAQVICHRDESGKPVATVRATPGHVRHVDAGRDTLGRCPTTRNQR